MSLKVIAEPLSEVSAEALVVGLMKEEALFPGLKKIDDALGGEISETRKKGVFDGTMNVVELFSMRGAYPAETLLLAGLGEKKEFEQDSIRQAYAAAAQRALKRNAHRIAFHIRKMESVSAQECARACVEGVLIGTYAFDAFKTKTEEEKKHHLDEILLVVDEDERRSLADIKKVAELSRIYAEAANYARDLANTPANIATPTYVAEKAKALAKEHGFSIRVIDRKEMEKLGMGGILAVSRGSDEPPKMLVLNYTPQSAKKKIGLVGKGITFDSGGISLKPAKNMDEMKFDKSGACAVLGAFKAASEAQLPVELVGVIPLTENLPSGSAQKPGDIIRPYKGKSVEVLNTDAEGRLILADALSFISEFKPDVVIDFATLTGACVVALGSTASGLMANDKKLVNELVAASEKSGEKIWELPLFKEYERAIKSAVADIQNVGNDKAGTITAACFLKNFIGGSKWAHLDIAGTAYGRERDEIPYYGKGSTGTPVRLICYFLENSSA